MASIGRVRPALPQEAAALSTLCMRSKRHWGYDEDFMRRCTASLTVREEAVRQGRVWVAVDDRDRPLGVLQLTVDGTVVDLDKLFVDPAALGTGVGAMLFRHALAAAQGLGGSRMTILADPNAAAFYVRMGARFRSMEPSDAIAGRELPLYEHDLAPPR
jgi:GNAT superfamily N-acetyltransferase